MHSRFHESGISFRVQYLTEFQEGLLMRVSSLANSLFIYVGLAFGSLWLPALYPAGAISVVSIYYIKAQTITDATKQVFRRPHNVHVVVICAQGTLQLLTLIVMKKMSKICFAG